MIAEIIASELTDKDVAYVIVNEAGASVYSTSEIGREEFPECDAIAARRDFDRPPVAGSAQRAGEDRSGQHRRRACISTTRGPSICATSLDDVVESCVNFVGVDLNTASTPLLRYVSGMNQLTARRVYEHRQQNGPFRSREQLLEVRGFGDATFVQAAGFLKIVRRRQSARCHLDSSGKLRRGRKAAGQTGRRTGATWSRRAARRADSRAG